jgi:ATP-dependent DNA ligase
MALPLEPPIKPQLAKTAKDLPEGDGWRYEPKWDGFRTIVFRDGDDVHLQSRNGKPMNRYFPEIPPQITSLGEERVVLDGELIVVIDGIQEFDLLGQRIHPAKSRVDMLAAQYPAAYVAFDLLAVGDETLLELPYRERRARLEQIVGNGGAVQLTPVTEDRDAAAEAWLSGNSEGVVAKLADEPYRPG